MPTVHLYFVLLFFPFFCCLVFTALKALYWLKGCVVLMPRHLRELCTPISRYCPAGCVCRWWNDFLLPKTAILPFEQWITMHSLLTHLCSRQGVSASWGQNAILRCLTDQDNLSGHTFRTRDQDTLSGHLFRTRDQDTLSGQHITIMPTDQDTLLLRTPFQDASPSVVLLWETRLSC